ncbi:MAG: Lrp/AsnC family transcriptional regulator [Fimbriimonadaceae bacterium]
MSVATARTKLLGTVTHPDLDETDLELLKLLQADGRTTNAELARRVSLSPPSVLHRVRKLEEGGFVQEYATVLDPEKLGFTLTVVAMVSLALHQDQPIENFRKKASEFPEVLECLHVSGDYDFMLKIVAKDIHDYERFVSERLSAIKGIGKIHSCFVLGVNKRTTALPI